MKILSLFDGLSCARIALERAEIPVEAYYASEIDKYAMQISAKNYPDIVQVGDVSKLGKENPYPKELLDGVDLIVFGSPCTDLSIAKKNRQGLKGNASGLFYEAVRIMYDLKPRFFLMENVASMSRESRDEITKVFNKYLSMKINNTEFPIMINAALVSAQNRKRLFWTNIPNVTLPEDKKLVIADVLKIKVDNKENKIITTRIEKDVRIRKNYIDTKKLCLFLREHKNKTMKEIAKYCEVPLTKAEHWFRLDSSFAIPEEKHWFSLKECLSIETDEWDKQITEFEIRKGKYDMSNRVYNIKGKHPTITTISGGHQVKTITNGIDSFFLDIEHYEEMQGIPKKYTEGISLNQRRKVLGNAFNVDVVSWILSFIPKQVI